MKVVITKYSDKLGDSYLKHEEVTSSIYIDVDEKELLMEVEGSLYAVPMSVFRGLLSQEVTHSGKGKGPFTV